MRGFALIGMAGLLAACGGEPPAAEPSEEATEVPEEFAAPQPPPESVVEGEGTPREERVATLGLLNKRNNLTRDIEIRPGESRRIGNVIVRLATCERTAPWESPPEEGGFVQVIVRERVEAGEDPQWRRVFSGWLFANAPALNVVEHPIYDVWMKDCAMTFPGEEASDAASDDSAA